MGNLNWFLALSLPLMTLGLFSEWILWRYTRRIFPFRWAVYPRRNCNGNRRISKRKERSFFSICIGLVVVGGAQVVSKNRSIAFNLSVFSLAWLLLIAALLLVGFMGDGFSYRMERLLYFQTAMDAALAKPFSGHGYYGMSQTIYLPNDASISHQESGNWALRTP